MPIDPLGDPAVGQAQLDPLGDPAVPQQVPAFSAMTPQVAQAVHMGLGGMPAVGDVIRGGTLSPRTASLGMKAAVGAQPLGNFIGRAVTPEWDQVQPQTFGEKMYTGTIGAVSALPTIVGGEALLAKAVPALAGQAIVPSVARSMVTGGTYGGLTEGPEAILPSAAMFGAGNVAGRAGAALGRAAVPISKEVKVGISATAKPTVTEGASGLTKMLGLVPAERLSQAAATVGAGLASAGVGHVFSGGEVSDTIIQGVLGTLGAHGKKTRILPDKSIAVGVEALRNAPKAAETFAKIDSLTESKYQDLKQSQANVGGQYRWEGLARQHGINPAAKEVQPIRDMIFMAEEAKLRGDVDHANDLYAAAEVGLNDMMRQPPVPQQGEQTPIKSSAELAMEKLNPPKPTLPKPEIKKAELPESGLEARLRRQGEQKILEFINLPDAELRKMARESALVEALQRQNQQGEKNTAIMQEAKQVVGSGQAEINETSSLTPGEAAELTNMVRGPMEKAEPVGGQTLELNNITRLAELLDRSIGRGLGQDVGPFVQMVDGLRKSVIKVSEIESKIYTNLEKALKNAGFKKAFGVEALWGSHMFDKTMREQYTGYRLSLFSDEKLAKLGYEPAQISALREMVRTLPKSTFDTFTKTDTILQNVFDQYFTKMEEYYKANGKRLSYEENFFPFYIDYMNKLTPADYGAVSPYTFAKEKSWKHRRAKFQVPENLLDPITAATRYIRESEMKLALDPYIKKFNYLRTVAEKGIFEGAKDPMTGQPILNQDGTPKMVQTVAPRTDIAKIFRNATESMSTSGYLDAIAEVLNSKAGLAVSRAVGRMLGQVVLTPSTVINSLLSTAGATGSEVGAFRFWRHLAKSLANPMFLGAAKDSSTLASRLYVNENHITNPRNFIENFFSGANIAADRILIKAAYNAAYEYAGETLFKHLAPEVRHTKSQMYADAFADRSMGIFNKVFKPHFLNQKWINLLAPFQTTAIASSGMLWHDALQNKTLTPAVRAQRVGTILATSILARLALSVFKGSPDNPTNSIQMALTDQLPIIGDFNRIGGGLSSFVRLTQQPSGENLVRTAVQYGGPKGSYAIYRLYNGLQAVLKDGIIRDKAGHPMYQFDTSDPFEIIRAITFSPYQTWGVSKQFGERHPTAITKVLRQLIGEE